MNPKNESVKNIITPNEKGVVSSADFDIANLKRNPQHRDANLTVNDFNSFASLSAADAKSQPASIQQLGEIND